MKLEINANNVARKPNYCNRNVSMARTLRNILWCLIVDGLISILDQPSLSSYFFSLYMDINRLVGYFWQRVKKQSKHKLFNLKHNLKYNFKHCVVFLAFGGTSFTVEYRVPLDFICIIGDWHSDAVYPYLHTFVQAKPGYHRITNLQSFALFKLFRFPSIVAAHQVVVLSQSVDKKQTFWGTNLVQCITRKTHQILTFIM